MRYGKEQDNARAREYYAKNKDREKARKYEARKRRYLLIEAAKSVPCADCEERYPACVMDFDHVRGTKLFDMGHGIHVGLKAFEDEMAKCEVVCANCHRMRTYGDPS